MDMFIYPICLYDSKNESRDKGLVISTSDDFEEIGGNVPVAVKAFTKPKDQCHSSKHDHVNFSSLRTFCGTAGGDSGGGFFIEVSPHYYKLLGVESSSFENGENSIYTNVTEFRSWIENIVIDPPATKSKHSSLGQCLK